MYSLDGQSWGVDGLTVGRNGGDPRGNAKTYVVELAQLPHCIVDLLRFRDLGIEGGLCVVKDDEGWPVG